MTPPFRLTKLRLVAACVEDWRTDGVPDDHILSILVHDHGGSLISVPGGFLLGALDAIGSARTRNASELVPAWLASANNRISREAHA